MMTDLQSSLRGRILTVCRITEWVTNVDKTTLKEESVNPLLLVPSPFVPLSPPSLSYRLLDPRHRHRRPVLENKEQ